LWFVESESINHQPPTINHQPSVDALAVLAALGVREVGAVEVVRGGWDTQLFRVEHDGTTSALRVFRPEQLRTFQREQLAMDAAVARGLPVPEVRAHAVWNDRPALLLAWVSGTTLLDNAAARPWRAMALGRAMGRVHARIHTVAAPPALGEGALLHMDYHPLNVMTDGRGITGVLDWANAAAGDPRTDVARTTVLLRAAPSPPSIPRLVVQFGRRVLQLGWRTGYADVRGPIHGLAPFYAAAGVWTVNDMQRHLGQPGVWLTESDLDRIRRWTEHWQRRAGTR
jgi:aminoglycoside phosphotransferase (APT) family kinase protein